MSAFVDADELGRLRASADRSDISQIIARYFVGVDRHDWDLVRSCYHDDAIEDHAPFHGSAEDFVAWVADFLPSTYARTIHVGSPALIDLDGDTATAETYAVVYHWSNPNADGEISPSATGGRLLDAFERRDGQWRITHRTLLGEWTQSLAGFAVPTGADQ